MKPADVIKLIKDKEVRYADLRFTDTRGKEQHVTIPANLVDEDLFRDGKMFDGSSIAGLEGHQRVGHDPGARSRPRRSSTRSSSRPRSTFAAMSSSPPPCRAMSAIRARSAERAEAYLKSTGIADGALFGPENEFFIFDSVRWNSGMNESSYAIDSVQRRVEPQHCSRRRQQGPSPRRQGRLLPGSSGRRVPGHPLGDVRCARGNGPQGRSAPPRSGDGRPVRNRRGLRRPREEGRRSADPQVRHSERRAQLRQDGHVHAEAAGR